MHKTKPGTQTGGMGKEDGQKEMDILKAREGVGSNEKMVLTASWEM